MERALAIDEKVYGRDHPELAADMSNLAGLLEAQVRALRVARPTVAQGEHDEAEPLYVRSLEIRKNALGGNHPDVAQSLRDLALLLWRTGRSQEAIPLQEKAIAIRKRRGETAVVAKYEDELAKLQAGEASPYRESQFTSAVSSSRRLPRRRSSTFTSRLRTILRGDRITTAYSALPDVSFDEE